MDGLERGVRLRFLTSDYLDFTDPVALHRLLALTGNSDAELRIMATRGARALHAKAYLFSASDGSVASCLVGSSNLTVAALDHNLEWNVEVNRRSAFTDCFEQVWSRTLAPRSRGRPVGDERWEHELAEEHPSLRMTFHV